MERRPPGPPRDLKRDQQIITYALQGLRSQDIALMAGVSRTSVENTLARYGYEKRYRWIRKDQPQ